jgi:hypothetical protein
MDIHVGSQGFFPWVIGDGEVFACIVKVPIWPHQYRLQVPKDCVAGWTGRPDEPLQEESTGILTARLDGWKVAVNAAGATPIEPVKHTPLGKDGVPIDGDWTGVEIVACFEDLAVGSVLAPDWRARKELLGWVNLFGGQLSTAPDDLTKTRVFTWDGRDGRPRTQPSTDRVCYDIVGAPSARLEFRKNGSMDSYVLQGNQVPITLTVDLAQPADDMETREVDLAHALAAMSLCDAQADQDVTYHFVLVETPIGAAAARQSSVRGSTRLRMVGRPNCGPRWLFLDGTRPQIA